MLLLILLQVIFLFLLFLGMVMYASEVETTAKKKKQQILPEIKKLTTAYTYNNSILLSTDIFNSLSS